MALRLISLTRSFMTPSLLVSKLKPASPPSRSYLLSRDRLVPFIDDVPCVFSKKALMHHWGVIPIVAICSIGLLLKVGVIICLGMKKDDVWYTKDSAYVDEFETRRGPWYRVRSRKWGGRDDYPVPKGALLGMVGDTDGPPYCDDDEDEDGDAGSGISARTVAAHIVVSSVVIGLATAIS